jgi:hypothetical protein
MEKAEALSNEIQSMKNQIYELEKGIIKKTTELESDCPHKKKCREYDDDYHNPHWYDKCLTCGGEFKIKYNK